MTACGEGAAAQTSDADTDAESGETQTADDGTTQGETGDGGPVCGDGTVDPGEDCDDGNDRNADGCNVDCRPSGEVEWAVVGAGEGSDSARGVDVAPNGEIVVVGRSHALGDLNELWVRRLDDTGETIWDAYPADNGLSDWGMGVDVDSDGRIAVVGVVKRAQSDFDPWIGVLDEGGAIQWSADVEHPASNDTATAIAFDDEGGVAFASLLTPAGETFAHLSRYDLDGVQLWDEEYPLGYDATGVWPIGPALTFSQGAHVLSFTEALPDQTGQSRMRWYEVDGTLRDDEVAPSGHTSYGATASEDGVVLAGSDRSDPQSAQLWTGRFGADGGEQWSANCGPTVGVGVAVDSVGDIVAVGYDLEGDEIAKVCKYAADGTPWWSIDLPLGVPGLAYDVAVGPDDEIYVVGELHPAALMEEAWIAKVTP